MLEHSQIAEMDITARPSLESSMMDWVEKRARQRDILNAARQRLWPHLCSAMEHAVRSFNTHFLRSRQERGDFVHQYEDRVVVTVSPLEGSGSSRSVTVTMDISRTIFEARYEDGKIVQVELVLDVDGQPRFSVKNTQMDVEQVSEFLLATLFFPPGRTD